MGFFVKESTMIIRFYGFDVYPNEDGHIVIKQEWQMCEDSVVVITPEQVDLLVDALNHTKEVLEK